MNAPPEDEEGSSLLRWGVYWLLIAIAIGGILGRMLAVSTRSTSSGSKRICSARDAQTGRSSDRF